MGGGFNTRISGGEMKPIKFKEQTTILSKPASMTDEECHPLPAWTDGDEWVSCWKPSIKERLSILFFGKIWLSMFGRKTQPAWVSCKKTFFKIKQEIQEGK